SHDLRSPLRSIMGFSQILKEDASDKLNVEEKEQFERIIGASRRMAELIDDILELGRVTRSEVQQITVNLSALAKSAVERLCLTDETREVDWQIEEGLTVVGDKKLLALMLDNLLGNACKYSSKQTRARIEFGRTVVAHDDKEGPVYFVRDNGVGFDMRYADKLFKPFHRLHHHTAFEGTGIGLATVQRIVHRHGGHIWAEAKEGKGATFFFTFPNA
ncbi:MAG: ATP-binding protein, partial [Acidiferrobacterales bacterium]